jgi:AbrB family looped-hinge helix DNA binding protein
MARLPATISPTRCPGTPISFAQPVLADPHRLQKFFPQEFAGRYRLELTHHLLHLVIVHDFSHHTFGVQYSNNHIFRQSDMEASKVGKRGAVVVPARLRRKFGIREGTLVIAEEREDGILLRPAVALPLEVYTPARRAEFLLSNAVNAGDYEAAVKEVKKMGLDPAVIPHRKPTRRKRG